MKNRLKEFRELQGWSQPKLSLKSGVAQTTISAIERGMIIPSVQTAQRLADALNRPIDDLFRASASNDA